MLSGRWNEGVDCKVFPIYLYLRLCDSETLPPSTPTRTNAPAMRRGWF